MHIPSSDAWASVSPKKARPFHKPMQPSGAVIKLAIRAAITINIKNESIICGYGRDGVDTG